MESTSFSYPNLSAAKLIGYDLETYDPYLKEDGPGWGRGVGYVLGVAVAVEGWSGYLPLGEKPREQDILWLKDNLETDVPKVGTNLQYDYGWLTEIGVWPKGLQMDIQFAEALLDDNLLTESGGKRSISLDSLAQEYLGVKKESSDLSKANALKFPWSKDFRENLWRLPKALVAKYAIKDAELPLRIIKLQWPMLQADNLTELFKLECRLIPLLVHMRRRGMPVNIEAAMEARDNMLFEERLRKKLLHQKAGSHINVNSSNDIAILFDKDNIEYPSTAKGNPSFTADFLNSCDAPIAQEILDLRKLIKARSTFVEGIVLDKSINGTIYPSLHPLRGEAYGTISGRFSCSQPNGQQIPKRDAHWAPLIRGLFYPEKGYPLWASMDLSQIEYRFFAHYANDPQLIAAYQDPDTDFHAAVGEIIGGNLPRIAMKTINFGLLYGMGQAKLTRQIASFFPEEANPLAHAKEIFDTYQANFPAAQRLLKQYASQVSMPPHEVTTILGRKSRFRLWEEDKPGQVNKAYPYNIAISKFGRNIRIASSYKAINRALQGSAADLMKKGMLDAYEAGIFKKTGYPHITVHDELCFSYHPDLREAFEDLRECVETCIALKVPIKMGLSVGPNWGQCKEDL